MQIIHLSGFPDAVLIFRSKAVITDRRYFMNQELKYLSCKKLFSGKNNKKMSRSPDPTVLFGCGIDDLRQARTAVLQTP